MLMDPRILRSGIPQILRQRRGGGVMGKALRMLCMAWEGLCPGWIPTKAVVTPLLSGNLLVYAATAMLTSIYWVKLWSLKIRVRCSRTEKSTGLCEIHNE